jgi:hypothetical protein
MRRKKLGKYLASPQGAVLIYKWNLIPSFSLYPPSGRGVNIDSSAVSINKNTHKKKIFSLQTTE